MLGSYGKKSLQRVFLVSRKQFVTKIYLRVKIKELLNNCFVVSGTSWVLEVYWRMARRFMPPPLASCTPLLGTLYLNRDPFN